MGAPIMGLVFLEKEEENPDSMLSLPYEDSARRQAICQLGRESSPGTKQYRHFDLGLLRPHKHQKQRSTVQAT